MYFKMSAEETAKRIDTNISQGLSKREAQERLSLDGANAITQKKKDNILMSFLRQLNEPMIYILFAAAILSAFVSEWADSLVILAIVLINAVIGVVQERKAEKALDALKKLTVTRCVVRRDGTPEEIPADDLAVGDIVLLDAGRVVPADLRLTVAANLKINESALTGESVPVEKDAAFIASEDIPLGDRVNMAYQGTIVATGRAEGIVVATGMSTEVGHIAEMLDEQDSGKTPLQKKLAHLGKILGITAVIACVVILIIGLLEKKEFSEMLLTAISLAVAVVPEGLTAVVTIVLALGVTRMVRRNAIVRHLPAVETLGSVNVICTDKTGTLTQNKMTVVEIYMDGKAQKPQTMDAGECLPLLHGMMLCNDASVKDGNRTGDPTELALLDLGVQCGLNPEDLKQEFPRIGELSFDSDRKMMTTLHSADGSTISYTKGAEDVIVGRCTHIWTSTGVRKITEQDIAAIDEQTQKMSEKALRVLALAMRAGDTEAQESDMLFVGLVGMIDPPRQEAIDSIAVCKQAGIRVIMITGDHKVTAAAIGKQVGIITQSEQVLSGAELDALSDDELAEKIETVSVYARVDPRHKVRLVNALKAKGNIVSMTGDGVNDAPSLKAADIGVAMGITGTDAAKDASDLVLTDDNFKTITHAVEEGRNIFENIKKAIYFLLSSNIGELFAVLIAIVLAWDSPLLPLHILWINLITDSLPALALGVDPGLPDIMRRKPRPSGESLFANGGWFQIVGYGLVISIVTLAAFRLILVSTGNLDLARTFALLTLAASQLFHSIGIRAGDHSIFRINHLSNLYLIGAFLAGVLLQVIVIYIPPLAALFKTQPVHATGWGFVILLSIAPLVVHELVVLVQKVIIPLIKKRK